jgi:hypothetical protein
MKTSNLANEALRQADVGQVWEEVLSGAAGTLYLKPFQTFRVRAAAAGSVTIDGTLAATMISGEILMFNAGNGQPSFVNQTTVQSSQVVVTIAGNQFVQIARDNTRKA